MYTVSELYDEWMKDPDEFLEKLGAVFGDREDFAEEYGRYITGFDPSGIMFATAEHDLAWEQASDIVNIANAQTDQIYASGLGDIRKSYKEEIGGYKEMQGSIGLRSGSLERSKEGLDVAVSSNIDTLASAYKLDKEEDLRNYMVSVVDASLDLDKSVYQEKEGWYDDVMEQMTRLAETDIWKADKDYTGVQYACPGRPGIYRDDYIDCPCDPRKRGCNEDGTTTGR